MNTTDEQRKAAVADIENLTCVVPSLAQFIPNLIADVEELKARLAQYERQEGLGK